MTRPLSALALLTLFAGGVTADETRFNRDIRPILSRNCFACHGPDEHDRKAGLRLDDSESARKGGKSDLPAIVPGHPDESELWIRISSTDPDDIMPPPESHHELTAGEKRTLRQWIAEGAAYEGHWAWIAPVKPEVPEIDGPTHPIDRFVAAPLREKGLAFAPEADRRTLLRRLSQDLTGLPPSIDELRAFEQDDRPEADGRLVDRLLASPHFGERMALPWLDAARYADTNGYSIDGGRDAWLWRDWVIKAFNENKPYDEFLLEQLAGDLLEDPTDEQLIATAFNRNHSVTHEGGTIPEENLVNYVVDRVKTTGEAILGLTTGCAQCHDHKYDPLKQEEYYRLFAFFNTLDDRGLDGNAGKNPRPFIEAPSPLATPREIAQVQRELDNARQVLAAPAPARQQQWERQLLAEDARRGRGFALIPLDHLTASLPNGNPFRLQVHDDQTVTVNGGDFSAYNICCRIPDDAGPVTGMRVVFEPGPNGTVGFGDKDLAGSFVMNTITASFSPFPAGNIDLNSAVPVSRVTASSHQAGFPPTAIHDTRPVTGWAPAVASAGDTQHLTITFEQPVDTAANPYVTAELVFNFRRGTSPARFRLFLIRGNDDDSPHPVDILSLLDTGAAQRTPEQAAALQAYFNEHSPTKANARHRVANLEERLRVLTGEHRIMVMNTSAKPRPTHFLERGVYSAKKHEVKPGLPAFLPPLPPPGDRDLNRLDLARWLVRDDHPLTARVAVNRIWQQLFGKGLVASSADFGSQGEWPSHPELLDWLAVHFRESGWDVKALVRLIVTSRTYRQSSDTTPEMLARDPRNDLLARGARFRLSAELVRDHALAVSDLLVERIGGPSVRPYHPGDLWRQVSHYGSTPATSQTYVQEHGEHLYRRSMYTYWKRTLPPPSMAAFDAPNREICTTDRGATNTPLQAFILMNDPQFVEASRHFAQRLLLADHPGDRERLAAGFERTTARRPGVAELDLLAGALDRELVKYTADPRAARALLAVGESPRATKIPAPEHAAWTNLCSLLLNLSESVTRR